MWGSVIELETRRRILLSLWAYAYEFENVSLVDDATFDREASLVNLTVCTSRPDLDDWFRGHFLPHTGMWIRQHLELDKLQQLFQRRYAQMPDFNDTNYAGKAIVQLLNDACKRLYPAERRHHLGASMIGRPCNRELWYGFRWVMSVAEMMEPRDVASNDTGQRQRLFNRGHEMEPRFYAWLAEAGFQVYAHARQVLHWHDESGSYFWAPEFNPGDGLVADVTGIPQHEAAAIAQGVIEPQGKQYRVIGHKQHYGGGTDGFVMPPNLPVLAQYFPIEPMGLELKTSNQKNFEKMQKEGVIRAKLEHVAQIHTYGAGYGMKKTLYLVINKNTDEVYAEVVDVDPSEAARYNEKAAFIIDSLTPPAKISHDPTFWACRFCDFGAKCHGGQAYDRNCRNCKFVVPTDGATWTCAKHNCVLPEDFILKTCVDYQEAR